MDLALAVTSSNVVAGGRPVHLGEAHVQRLTEDGDLGRGQRSPQAGTGRRHSYMYLCVCVDVPEVQPALSVHTGKHGWVGGAPLNIVHILTVVLKGAERAPRLALREGEATGGGGG